MAIDSPITIDKQIVEMKKYVTFRKKVKIKRLLEYAGYFRVSRYGKYLLSRDDISSLVGFCKIFRSAFWLEYGWG